MATTSACQVAAKYPLSSTLSLASAISVYNTSHLASQHLDLKCANVWREHVECSSSTFECLEKYITRDLQQDISVHRPGGTGSVERALYALFEKHMRTDYGFVQLGRFAERYRRQFTKLPADTLMRRVQETAIVICRWKVGGVVLTKQPIAIYRDFVIHPVSHGCRDKTCSR